MRRSASHAPTWIIPPRSRGGPIEASFAHRFRAAHGSTIPPRSRGGPIEAIASSTVKFPALTFRRVHAAAPLKPGESVVAADRPAAFRRVHAAAPLKLAGLGVAPAQARHSAAFT